MPRAKQDELVPTLGATLAPPPDDLVAVMTQAEVLEDLKPIDSLPIEMEGMERGQALSYVSDRESFDPRRSERGVRHKTGPLQTLYNVNGDSRSVTINDIPMLIDPTIPAPTRMYLRCPICLHTASNGLHRFSGPNACPAKAKKLWSACPICREHGREHRVFEDEAFGEKPRDLDTDENYVAPRLPDKVTRGDRLLQKLNLHMTTFHAAEAYQLFGIRRRNINGGQAFIAEESENRPGEEDN